MVSPTRRGFLRSLCAATAATATASSGVTAKRSSGKIVFIYDDSPAEDYDVFRIHREENIPGCSAVVSKKLGTDGFLTAPQLREMESGGWEILSHTTRHRALDEIPFTGDVQPGDTRLPVNSGRHGAIPGDRLVVSDADHEEVVTVTGREEADETTYLTLEKPVNHGYRVEAGANERYTDEIVHTALSESKAALEKTGVSVSNVVMPYGRYGKQAQRMVPQVYDAVGNATWDNGINDLSRISPYQLSRRYFKPGSMTETELKEFLDHVSHRNVLGILAGHTQYEDFSKTRLRTVIRMIKRRNIEVVTLREALIDANVVKTPSTKPETSTTSHTQLTSTNSQKMGETSGNGSSPSRKNTSSNAGSSGPDIFDVGLVTGLAGISLGILAKRRKQ